MNIVVIALVVGLVGMASIAGGAEQGPPPKDPGKPNVLLITIDSFRPDHIGAYGYRRATTPTIDRLARRGVIFRAAVNQDFAGPDHPVAAGDEVAFFPPVTGG